jgi:hypothetical protein
MEALATRAGISRSILYWSEVAPSRMSERTALAVARILRLKPEDLRP